MRAAHVTLAPGESTESLFVLGAGHRGIQRRAQCRALRENARSVRRRCDHRPRPPPGSGPARAPPDGADLDLLMNRNFLFTALYAWGRTIDTEQFVGVTSRSPRYYVSAAYWDRDAMLWSFPGAARYRPADGARRARLRADDTVAQYRHAQPLHRRRRA